MCGWGKPQNFSPRVRLEILLPKYRNRPENPHENVLHFIFYCNRRCVPFVDFAQSETGELHNKVCDGCPTNCTCTFKEPGLAPQCISLVDAGIEHAYSNGGLSTVEDLYIFKGYWRATNTSTIVRKCYNPIACPEGLTTGNCNTGYKGPCECSMIRTVDDLYPFGVIF